MKKIAHIVLAAGRSSRMGKIKQLLPVKDTFLLQEVLNECSKLQKTDLYVVLGANFELISNRLCPKISIIKNDQWEFGLSTSIRSALIYFEQNKLEYDAVLISLGDQPLINIKLYNHLINNYLNNEKNIVCTQYREDLGVPAIFDKKYFSSLKGLEGDKGAKIILSKLKPDVLAIDANNLLIDLDTEEDYQKFLLSI